MHQCLAAGDVVAGRYQIAKSLGCGGSGCTYAARDLETGGDVALKELSLARVTGWNAVDLFEREARVLAALDHPSIPRYVDHFHLEDGARLFLVQALAAGRSLGEMLEAGWEPTEADARDVAAQLLEILVYLQSLSPPVIHRDIKPANLLRTEDGRIHLVDFGSVKDGIRSINTLASSVVGTFGYMAPEQFQGRAGMGTDLYGLGATIVHLLAREPPSELPHNKLAIDFRGEIELSEPFASWLETMLAPAPEDRFPSARVALDALRFSASGERALSKVAEPPFGSRIEVAARGGQLGLKIPARGLDWSNLGALGFAMFWLLFVAFWTWGAAHASILFACFSIPFWAVGVALVANTVSEIATSTELSIGPGSFALVHDTLGKKRRITGETVHLDGARIAEDAEHQKRPRLGEGVGDCVLEEGVHAHRFGTGLTEVERRWLVDRVNAYLALIRPRD